MKKILLLLSGALLLIAGDTRMWVEGDAQSFQKGTLTNLSVRSDGRLTLAPRIREVYDASTAYLWALAQDSHGIVYTGGGPGAKLFRIPPVGKVAKIAEFDALEIHAIAIDSKDHIYVATAPDGKVYRVSESGKSQEFYDPKQKYIWGMALDRADNLYIATGDQGEVHRVTPDGQGAVFYKSDETHARSIAFDHDGNLIVGTEPGGLVIRVGRDGQGFVLYQMPKREVTALAIGPGNEIYAAAVGTKAIPLLTTPAPVAAAAVARPTSGNIALGQLPNPPAATPAIMPANIPGGTDIYRITSQDIPEKLWSGAQDVVYALAFDAGGKLLVASGNKGALYRIESRTLYTTLRTFPVSQVTALLPWAGSIIATTGNVGKVFRAGPSLEAEGSIESEVFDSGGISTWGRVTSEGDRHGGKVTLMARSGNLDRPQQNWSPWSQDPPAARFIQWKAVLAASPSGESPALDSVSAAYLRKNAPPRIDVVETTPANYKFPAPVVPLTISSTASISLPPVGAAPSNRNLDFSSTTIYPSMQYAKGWVGVRWSETDENGDTLVHKIEIRGEKEKNWRLLRDKILREVLFFRFDDLSGRGLSAEDYRKRFAFEYTRFSSRNHGGKRWLYDRQLPTPDQRIEAIGRHGSVACRG